ncbi:flippase [Xenorhabdus khoisanae]|uniref:flippase n=1 Tax=Xenorhabdus khoisanae TaxID=880157 RepID=UPI0032B7D3A6
MDKVILKNIFSLFSIQGMNYIIPLITLPYLVRVLGPAGYGSLGFALALVQYCCLITDYGFNLSATKQIAIHSENKKKVSKLFWNVMTCKIVMATLCIVIINIAILLIPQLSEIKDIINAGLFMVLGNVLFPIWLFQGKEEMGWIALANISARLLAIPLIFIFVTQSNDANIAALITSVTTVIAGIIGLYFVKCQNWITWYKPTLSGLKKTMQEGWHIFISTAAISLYTTSTTVILGFISGPIAVGYFVAADKLRQAVQGLITPISQSFYPRISFTMTKSKTEGYLMISKLLRLQGAGALFLSIAVFSLAPFIINFIYGSNYRDSIPVLMLMAWLPFIIGLSNIFGIQTLLVLGYRAIFSKILIFSGFINIILIIPLTYLYNEIGATISVLLTEIIVTTIMLLVIINKKLPIFKGK